MRSMVWFFTRTRMSRTISLSPIGAAWAHSGSMYRCQRSAGSITCMSLSATRHPLNAMNSPSKHQIAPVVSDRG